MKIRQERATDNHSAIRLIHDEAFQPSTGESKLVDALRSSGKCALSLLAEEDDGQLVGHVLFSPVTIRDANGAVIDRGLALAPLAIRPAWQRRGIGSALVRAAIEQLTTRRFIVLLGHVHYYSRFGFESTWQLQCKWGNDGGAFQVLTFADDVPTRGFVEYADEFDEL